MPKFVVNIDAPGVGVTRWHGEAPTEDAAIDQAIQDYLVSERGPGRHRAKLREESLASATITATRVK